MSVTEQVRRVVEPILEGRGVELYDLELAGRTLRVLVDREGGVDVDTLGRLSRDVSAALDDDDPVPGGRYTLEVSSPGLERPLRRPEHFRRAVGARIALKTTPETEGERRVEGELAAVDEGGVTVALDGGERRRVAFNEIARARTVFEWGPGSTNTKRAATS